MKSFDHSRLYKTSQPAIYLFRAKPQKIGEMQDLVLNKGHTPSKQTNYNYLEMEITPCSPGISTAPFTWKQKQGGGRSLSKGCSPPRQCNPPACAPAQAWPPRPWLPPSLRWHCYLLLLLENQRWTPSIHSEVFTMQWIVKISLRYSFSCFGVSITLLGM